MPQVGTIHKLAGSKYLSLYQMDAVQRDGTHFDYYMASRIGDAARLKAATKENHADGVCCDLAANDRNRIVLIRYRYPGCKAGLSMSCPPDWWSGGEPRQAAVRELFEENRADSDPRGGPRLGPSLLYHRGHDRRELRHGFRQMHRLPHQQPSGGQRDNSGGSGRPSEAARILREEGACHHVAPISSCATYPARGIPWPFGEP